MKIYNFDRVTGVYLGVSDADPSPMDQGEFLIPAFATHIEPPEAQAGFVAVFDRHTDLWSVQPVAVAPEPAAPTPPTFEERVRAWRLATREHSNIVAIGQDFDSIDEAVGFAEEPAVPKFQMQGRALRAWRSVLWEAFDVMVSGIREEGEPEPTDAENLRSRLPAFTPPDTSPEGIAAFIAANNPPQPEEPAQAEPEPATEPATQE